MKITGKAVSNHFQVQDTPRYFYGRRIPRTWIMVIDRKKAHVFYKTPSGLDLIADARLDPKEQGTDINGFPAALAAWLEEANENDAFDRLVLVAAPRMLGEVREQLSAHVRELVVGEIDKDMTNLSVQDVKRGLANVVYFKD